MHGLHRTVKKVVKDGRLLTTDTPGEAADVRLFFAGDIAYRATAWPKPLPQPVQDEKPGGDATQADDSDAAISRPHFDACGRRRDVCFGIIQLRYRR